ncbi:competence protein ComEA [Virgibacillus natechei]|uniref:Competence protein ComEA n=1 Tax=Virgibacillus natechei TaxID=1216297 RepID=A0ABS4ICQ6_9BACI|nr:helix-hairpin-helix domain-containing protein [Virgibacillus natechei]MBP1968727.1 competence protein ComEA [Virgibacillus natechei]UZD11529.1 helix-hairpin-helix domain-containing protein [Virgibacillus natechei]
MIDLLKKSSFFIALAGIILAFLFFTRAGGGEENNTEFDAVTPTLDEGPEQDNDIGPNETVAFVDIKGAVVKPGVYEMDTDDRVDDLIQIAGGFTEDADQSQVNLAQKVQDEMSITIPMEGEETQEGNNTSTDSGKVKINDATQEEIESLNGVGPSKAQAIIDFRDEYGLFQTPEDLLEVSGIGETTLENLLDAIQVP